MNLRSCLPLVAALLTACGETSPVTTEGDPTAGTSTSTSTSTTSPPGQVTTTAPGTTTGDSPTSSTSTGPVSPTTTEGTTTTSGTTTEGTTTTVDTTDGTSTTSGEPECVELFDCEQVQGPCVLILCKEFECVVDHLEPGGTDCAPDQVCDDEGQCVDCYQDYECDFLEYCDNGECFESKCFDGVHNADETDVDCGGYNCDLCEPGQHCVEDNNCKSSICVDEACLAPTCSDGVQNGVETAIDCGGADCSKCEDGEHCIEGSDCLSGSCEDFKCASQ